MCLDECQKGDPSLSPLLFGARVGLHGGTTSRTRIPMIAFLTIELRIEAAHSLKDKRQVTRSLKDRLRAGFNVAVAELDHNDLWQRATIGVISISDSHGYLEGLMQRVEREATKVANNNGAQIEDTFLDFL